MATETVIVDFNFGQSFKRLTSLKKQIADLNKDTKALSESTDEYGEVTLEAAQAIEINEASTRALKDEQRLLRKSVDDVTKSQDAAVGSIVANRVELSRLKAEYIKLAKPTKEQANRIKELNDRLKEQEADIGVTSRNVGNYSESIQDAANKSGLFTRELTILKSIQKSIQGVYQQQTNAIRQQAAATTGTTTATKLATGGLKLFKIALAATGVGLLVVALGSLITFLTQTQRGMDAVKVATGLLSTVFRVIIDRISQFGEGLSFILKGDLAAGIEKLRGSFKGLGDEIRKEAKESIELTKASQELRDSEIELIEVNARRRRDIALLRIEAKKEQNDLETRKKALQGAVDLEKEILNSELEIARERARISQERIDQAESTAEQQRENAELQADLFRIEEQTQKKILTLTAEASTLFIKSNRERSEGSKDAAKDAELLLELQEEFITSTDKQIKKINERAEAFRKAGAEEVDVQRFVNDEFAKLEEEQSAKLLEEINKRASAEEQAAMTSLLNLKTRFNEEILAAEGNAEKIAEIERRKNEEVLRITKEQIETQLQILQEQISNAVATVGDEGILKSAILSDSDRAALENNIALLNEALSETKIQLDDITTDEEGEPFNLLEAIGIDEERFEFGIGLAQQGLSDLGELFSTLSQNRIIALENERDRALKGAKGDANRQVQIESKFNKQIDAEKKKAFEQNKKIQIATATIQMLTGIISAINAGMQAGGPLGIILAALFAGFVATTGGIQIANIKKQSFAKGGEVDVGGKSHQQGGTTYVGEDGNMFEVQRKEKIFVLNKRASGAIRSLSNINESFGGRSFYSSPKSFGQAGGQIADGGFSARQISSSIEDRFALADTVTEAVAGLNMQVSVTEINEVNEEVTNSVEVVEL